jgi:hypothetical protein
MAASAPKAAEMPKTDTATKAGTTKY